MCIGKFKKAICLMLCLILPTAVSGCNKNLISYTPAGDVTEKGTHEETIAETGKFIAKNGVSDYSIVVPADVDSNTTFAASELQSFLKDAGGAYIPVITDSGLIFDENSKYLSVGDTVIAATAGISFDISELGNNGAYIRTVGNSVIIGGATGIGNINAVYEFLARTIGYETFTSLTTTFIKSDKIPLLNLTVKEIPDIEWRVGAWGSMSGFGGDAVNNRRLRLNTASDLFMGPNGLYWHNTFTYLPKDKYLNNSDNSLNHPKWYADNGAQLCYTAHGDEKEYQAMCETIFGTVKELVKSRPDTAAVSITIQDTSEWCACEACAKEKEKYGNTAPAATVIKLTNRISEMLDEWIKTNDEGVPRDRVVKVVFFAYVNCIYAPVVRNADGTYSPIDQEVVCAENVVPFYAPLGANHTKPFTHSANDQFRDLAEQWLTLADDMYLWLYQTNFYNYLFPYNSINAMPETYRYFSEKGASAMFNQGQTNNANYTAFHELKVYLNGKLGWNAYLNLGELIDNYFANVFGAGAESMKQYYYSLGVWLEYLQNHKGLTSDVYFSIAKADYFPKPLLDGWYDLILKAEEAVLPLKNSDPERYRTIMQEINKESIFVRYALTNFYSGYYSKYELNEMRKSFISDVQDAGIAMFAEGMYIDAAYGHWELF